MEIRKLGEIGADVYGAYNEDGEIMFSFVSIEEMGEPQRSEFIEFLYGQTVPMVPGHRAAYSWDYENFQCKKRTGREAYWD
jgi:hypothetical protein